MGISNLIIYDAHIFSFVLKCGSVYEHTHNNDNDDDDDDTTLMLLQKSKCMPAITNYWKKL
jgi:hypothetical protein